MAILNPVVSGETTTLEKLVVEKPFQFKSLWYRALALAGLRRSNVGGFGSAIPVPSQSGGGYYGGFG